MRTGDVLAGRGSGPVVHDAVRPLTLPARGAKIGGVRGHVAGVSHPYPRRSVKL